MLQKKTVIINIPLIGLAKRIKDPETKDGVTLYNSKSRYGEYHD